MSETLQPMHWRGYIIPAGTRVRFLAAPVTSRWVIDQFNWLPQWDGFNRHNAEHYGIDVHADNVSGLRCSVCGVLLKHGYTMCSACEEDEANDAPQSMREFLARARAQSWGV